MGELKTKQTDDSVEAYLNRIADPAKREDCRTVAKLMTEITGQKPKMWGASIVGFGSYHYIYASGQEGDWPMVAFSPRKQNLTLYVLDGTADETDVLNKLGKTQHGQILSIH